MGRLDGNEARRGKGNRGEEQGDRLRPQDESLAQNPEDYRSISRMESHPDTLDRHKQGGDANPVYRSRAVGKEFDTGPMDGVFAGTPPLEVLRYLVYEVATVRVGEPDGV